MDMKRIGLVSVALAAVAVGLVIWRSAVRPLPATDRLPAPPAAITYDQPIMDESRLIDEYEKKASKEPGSASFNAAAQAYFRLGKKSGKEEYFEKAKSFVEKSLADQSTGNKSARLLSIRLLQAQHEFEKSLVALAEFEKEFQGSESGIPLKVTALVALGRASEAEAIVKDVVAKIPTAPAFVLAGMVAEESGKPKEAFDFLATALDQEEPSDASTLTFPRALLARLYLRRGQLDEARSCLNAALKIDENDVMSLRLLAHLEAFEGKWRESEQALARALGAYSDADILVQLSRVKRLAGETKQADDLLRAAEATFREDLARSHYGHRLQFAQLLLEKSDRAAAAEAVEIARADLASRGHPFVKMTLAQALLASGDGAGGREVLKSITSYEHPALFRISGLVERATGHATEAEASFDRAESIHPAYVEACRYCPIF